MRSTPLEQNGREPGYFARVLSPTPRVALLSRRSRCIRRDSGAGPPMPLRRTGKSAAGRKSPGRPSPPVDRDWRESLQSSNLGRRFLCASFGAWGIRYSGSAFPPRRCLTALINDQGRNPSTRILWAVGARRPLHWRASRGSCAVNTDPTRCSWWAHAAEEQDGGCARVDTPVRVSVMQR